MSSRYLGVTDKEILRAIRRLGHGGVAPTYAELAQELGFASTSSVRYRVLRLEESGLIRRKPGTPRAIVLGVQP